MKKPTTLKTSIHSPEHIWLRNRLISRRKELHLSQRELAKEMGVIFSFIGKVETGDRRLDLIEFIKYCKVLDIDTKELLTQLEEKINKLPTY